MSSVVGKGITSLFAFVLFSLKADNPIFDQNLSTQYVIFIDRLLFFLGRLLRAYGLEFPWNRLAAWINITEQWPYRLSWIILEVEDHDDLDDATSLKDVFDR